MKKNSSYFLILFSFFLLISCGNDDSPVNEPEVVSPQTKDISFSFDVVEISNKDAHKNKGVNEALLNKVIVGAASVVITIQDESNTIIYNREKLDLNNENDTYISSSISLDFGNYTITEFMVLDAQDNAIYLTPKVGSDIAPNVTKVLPISLTVGASTDEQISLKVLDTNNLTAEDFGYTNFDYTILGKFTFVIDQTDELSEINMTLDSASDDEYIVDWGDESTDTYLTTSLSHLYSEQGIYTVTVTGNIKVLKSLLTFKALIIDIDLSNLESLNFLHLSSSKLTSLDVSSNLLLEYCAVFGSNSELTSIDVSSNVQLKQLTFIDHPLTSIDLSNNLELTNLGLINTQLNSIDLSNNMELENLELSSNPQITNLDISSHTKLRYLNLNYMSQLNLSDLDLSLYPELIHLGLDSNELTNIDVSKNIKLQGLSLWNNYLTNIDLSANTELIQFNLDGNQLTNVDLSTNSKLEILHIRQNPIETLDISNNPFLKAVYISDNQINDIVNMETIYSQLLENVKANNISNGIMNSQNNNYEASQTLIDIANELINDYNWEVTY